MHENIFHSFSKDCGCPRCRKLAGDCYVQFEVEQMLDGLTFQEAVDFMKGKAMLKGVGPDAPMVENESGGRQSHSPYRFDLLPPHALAKVAEILCEGCKSHGEWNWLKIHANDHLNRVLQHSMAYIAGDTQEGSPIEHAARVACRALMFLEMAIREEQATEQEKIDDTPQRSPLAPAAPILLAGRAQEPRYYGKCNSTYGTNKCTLEAQHTGSCLNAEGLPFP